MYSIRCIFLLQLASAYVYCRHVNVLDKTNFGIIGGTPINITEVPFMALYRPSNKSWGCGAAIVADQFLVTAGHCVKDTYDRVTVGTDKALAGGNNCKIEKVIRHPEYILDFKCIQYDIAVIKLKEKLVFNEKINKINMADSSMILNDGDMLQAIGFGLTEHSKNSNELLSVKLPFVNQKKCQKNYENYDWRIREEMMCAGGESGKGSCYGDSGSPLFYKSFLYGITSWCNPCAHKDYPTVFTSVPFMKDFIEDVIQKNG
ncbi:hypothetical protein O0L34_g14589 [Tuta absoluta]|nr:hypothetical protein O0L34_g14589 [Tuta absoluta]